MWIWFVLALFVALLGYVRFAPTTAYVPFFQPHGFDKPAGDYPRASGFVAVRNVEGNAAELVAKLEQIILATPRTHMIAAQKSGPGRVYQTRSLVFGFPDYTEVSVQSSSDGAGELLVINGNLRFGKSDLGVNSARIRGWLAELGL